MKYFSTVYNVDRLMKVVYIHNAARIFDKCLYNVDHRWNNHRVLEDVVAARLETFKLLEEVSTVHLTEFD